MAGKNIILETGQVLFHEGDQSNGMFLVRQGELRVYLEQDGHEVSLATVSSGGMIGEMALFDQKPRSASVKAVAKTEVTHISNEDFAKLMKQIPKWFTALMGTLSGRLRATNERLQKMEAKSSPSLQSMELVRRTLYALELLWHRDGTKEGKEWLLEKKPALEAIVDMFGEEAAKMIEKTIAVFCQHGYLSIKKNSYKSDMLVSPNRAALSSFLKFLSDFIAKANQPALPLPALELLKCIDSLGEKSAYDAFTVSLAELEAQGQKARLASVKDWKNTLPSLSSFHQEEIQIAKASGGLGVRTKKQDIKSIVRYHSLIYALYQDIQS